MVDNVPKKLSQRACVLVGTVFDEVCASVEIPGEQRDRSLCSPDGCRDRGVVIGTIDQQREAIRTLDTPAIPACLENSAHSSLFIVSGFRGEACRFLFEMSGGGSASSLLENNG